jgi:peptidoglycan/xylan/chitin deacetylase (PgdA/CDA1 family)
VRALGRFRPLRVTFDDAFRSIGCVVPFLEALRMPIEVFVCSSFARTGGALAIPELETNDPDELVELSTLTWDDLRSLASRGIEIGSHTVSHPHLTRLTDAELSVELKGSKDEIEDELGRRCVDLAYPYGEHNRRVCASARRAGYERAYVLWRRRRDSYATPRLDLYRRHTVARTLLRAASPRLSGRLA